MSPRPRPWPWPIRACPRAGSSPSSRASRKRPSRNSSLGGPCDSHFAITTNKTKGASMRINYGRVLLGGLVAGIVMDAYEAVMNGQLMRPQWAAIMTSLNRPQYVPSQIILFNIVGLVTGFAAAWTYAAIRPRFGSGPRTALIAAALTWLTAKAIV